MYLHLVKASHLRHVIYVTFVWRPSLRRFPLSRDAAICSGYVKVIIREHNIPFTIDGSINDVVVSL